MAARIGLTDYGRRIFYVAEPKLQPAADFNRVCPESEGSIVLGCYNGQQIHIFTVQDARLDGIEEVTAAHELLHAAYDRLGASHKQQLNSWLEGIKQNLTNQRIVEVIESYDHLGQDKLYNELHSIFGTEMANLPDYLEDYYASYFNDRQAIVVLSQAYEAVFHQLEQQVDQLDDSLAIKKDSIEAQQQQLDQQLVVIYDRQASLNQLLSSDQVLEYNQGVASFNNLLAIYQAARNQLQIAIDDYNQLVEQRNQITIERSSLVDSINSRHQADPQL